MTYGKRHCFQRLLAALLCLVLTAGFIPVTALPALAVEISAAATGEEVLENGYLTAVVSRKNGCFTIRTTEGDKLNKDDNNKNLLFPLDDDATSFTSFRVTRSGETKDYIFGGSYAGSSGVAVQKAANGITATWSVDGLTFVQTISLVNTGANEHGMAYVHYGVTNTGAAADIKARVLMDTALGNQDYAYYRVGDQTIEKETELGANGYGKSFYCYDDPHAPRITAYTVNAAVDGKECAPVRTVFAHWNNLAASVFDYVPDSGLTFTNPNNRKYLTADSACALYYNLGTVSGSAAVAVNYGVYSNEKVSVENTAAVNVTAPDAMALTADSTAYEKGGAFTARTAVQNIGDQTYERVRVVVYTTGSLSPTSKPDATYDDPYFQDIYNFTPDQRQTLNWDFTATPLEEGVYAALRYKVYDISGGEQLLADRLMGEGEAYILCPGSVEKVPEIQFTGSSPEILYPSGYRSFCVTGKNFNMLSQKSDYQLLLSWMDGGKIAGQPAVEIPAENISFDVADGKNSMTVTLTDDAPGQLPEGQYRLTFDYTDAGKQDLSAPALRFWVKDEEKYRPNTYGLLAVVKSGTDYSVKSYPDEASYAAANSDESDVLLKFRGIFTKKKTGNPADHVYTGVSLSSGDNVMTLNDCLDIENGTVTVRGNNGTVYVDFNASLYTTGSRTQVYKGVCALTALKKGTDYGLIQYSDNGEREDDQPENKIALLWPSIGQAAQNLLGFLMDFRYGELGVMESGTRVVAFGASMDLSFVIPDFLQRNDGTDNQSVLGDAYNSAVHVNPNMTADDIRALNEAVPYDVDMTTSQPGPEEGGDDGVELPSGSIHIDDVLFGGRFVGVNLTASIEVPGYIDGTPALEGELKLNTVGNWSVGVSGSCDFEVFAMEGSIDIKSKSNIPIPDSIHFYVGNCTPGLPLDPCGVLWLQGAGGGIENVYDTIFLNGSVPPLKLILEAQFSLMQVISAKASLALSLRGMGVTLSDGNVGGIDVLDSAAVQLDWYPEFYFMSSVNVNILEDIITGGGYIVAEQNGFFEFFVQAALKLPDSLWLIGGMTVGGVGLGANAEKLWGQAEVIGLTVGIVYYWGEGSVSWDHGSNATPTYPDLLGRARSAGVPVAYDAEHDRTLYAIVGTNLARLRGESANRLTSAEGGYSLALGGKSEDMLLMLEWTAASKQQAQADAGKITIKSGETEQKKLVLLNHNQDARSQQEANANLTYDATAQKASLAVSFTEDGEFDKEWTIFTGGLTADAVLYSLKEMPKLGTATIPTPVSSNTLTVNFDKVVPAEFNDDLIFTAIPEGNAGGAVLLAKQVRTAAQAYMITLPDDLPSGSYTVHIVANDKACTYHSEVKTGQFTYTNPNAPAAPSSVSAAPAGDYRLDVTVTPTGTPDGYRVNIYDSQNKLVDGVSGVQFPANESVLTVGGQLTINTAAEPNATPSPKTVGLTAGSYTVGVSAYKKVGNKIVYSDETKSRSVPVPVVSRAALTFGANETATNVTTAQGVQTFTIPTYKANDLTLTITASKAVTGRWTLDGGTKDAYAETPANSGTVTTATSIPLPFEELEEGVHTLEFTGQDADKNSVHGAYVFGVDTLPPRLLLSSPVNGSLFPYSGGKVTISGITDAGAALTVTAENGSTLYSGTPALGADGSFTQEVTLDKTKASQTLRITARDALGNETAQTVELTNDALGRIESLHLYSGGTEVSNRRMDDNQSCRLTVKAALTGGGTLDLTGNRLLEWSNTALSRDVTLTENTDGSAALNIPEGARGLVTARLLVSDLGSAAVSAAYGASSDTQTEPTYSYPVTVIGGTGSGSYGAGTTVTITATVPDGKEFTGWTVNEGGVTLADAGSATTTFTMPAHGVKVTANFTDTENPLYLVTVNGGTGGGSYASGTTVTITAAVPDGKKFAGWTVNQGGVTLADAGSVTTTFIMPAQAVTVTANFQNNSGGGDSGGGGYDSPSASTYPVTILTEPSHGRLTISPRSAARGSIVTITVIPEDGYRLGALNVTSGGKSIPLTEKDGGKYTFTMPAGAVKVEAIFVPDHTPETPWSNPFTDVAEGAWYYDAVRYVNENGLVGGYGNGLFGPHDHLSRAQFAQILFNKEGRPVVNYLLQYGDVAINTWYTEAVRWATSRGVVGGYGNGNFGPNDPITREQLAVMLWRYSGSPAAASKELHFNDADEISGYALEALCWAVENGIMNGYGDGRLDPQGATTRAQAAQILKNFLEK